MNIRRLSPMPTFGDAAFFKKRGDDKNRIIQYLNEELQQDADERDSFVQEQHRLALAEKVEQDILAAKRALLDMKDKYRFDGVQPGQFTALDFIHEVFTNPNEVRVETSDLNSFVDGKDNEVQGDKLSQDSYNFSPSKILAKNSLFVGTEPNREKATALLNTLHRRNIIKLMDDLYHEQERFFIYINPVYKEAFERLDNM